MTPDELRAIKERDRLCTAENATLKSVLEDCAEADRRALLAEVEALSRDLAEMRRQINAMRQDCNTMCNALQRIEAGERDPRMIARRTLEHWSEKAALTSKEPRDG